MLVITTNWRLSFLYQLRPFKHRNLEIYCTLFQHYLHEKEVLYTPTFYMKMYDLNIVFYIARDKWQCFYFSP